ncbi:4-alpha-glucanotransferase [Puniceibacterium sediminis]|uniref:4-alpha-glucanotransferase n=1 Tax=Puniceibacterium sediminis TaxID=1608407 RepID=A0A238V0T6_9RHOB|nr:4-alpha-glucanotransferase [Puniceibacterium sediminis]SNR27627.1 4-alpha-glucanotransferase [Puniceibacterium sediminis]
MTEALTDLAVSLGVVPSYVDQTGTRRDTSRDTAQALLTAMGHPVANDAEAQELARHLASQAQALPRWHVCRPDRPTTLPIPEDAEWHITREDGHSQQGRGPRLPSLPMGRHVLHMGAVQTTLLVAPARLPLPPRLWGLIVPLAGLRSAARGGIGDYHDLGHMAQGLGDLGAAFLGINPVHAGFSADPSGFSPYTPSHRRRLSTLHLHVPDEVPLQGHPLINYPNDIPARLSALEGAYHAYTQTADPAAFEAYLIREGAPLQTFATHQALSERHGAYWNLWPADLQNPDSDAVAQAARDLGPRLRFHAWLQWMAEEQLGQAARTARDSGMALGLYLDLAVGTHPHGAETWEDRTSFAFGASLGAPPDAFSKDGQNWQLAPFNPQALIDGHFAALAETLRRQFRSSGMLRIDHILGFDRAFWVPDGAPGAYVQMPLDAMLAVVRIEAARAGAVVVGEDLGNIPDGLQKALAASGILGCRLTIFEQNGRKTPRFRSPRSYPQATIASFSTHDLPTWDGWREGHEIALRRDLGTMDPEPAQSALDWRGQEVAALDRDTAKTSDTAPDDVDSMHDHLGRSASRVAALQIENILRITEQPNLPGTTTEYPNWRQRLPAGPDELLKDPRLAKAAAVMKRHGR